MPILFIFTLCYFLCAFCDTIKLRKNVNNITYINENKDLISFFSQNKYSNYFFVNNNGSTIKKNYNKNKLFLNINDSAENSLTIEKFKSSNGYDFLFTKLFMNNEENKFLVDLCSDNSFIFQKKTKILKNEKENNSKEYMSLNYNNENIQNTKKEIHLNNRKVISEKSININFGTKNFHFYLINNEELSKDFDGIIGFDFFKNFDNFIFDTINMNILLNENNYSNNKEDFYEIKLHDYFNNIKYINVNVNNHLHKGILDTGSSRTIIVNSDNLFEGNNEEGNITIENILNNKYKVQKVFLNNFDIISSGNKLIPINLNTIYKGNLEYLDSNVVLLGLDFLLNKKIIFDLKNRSLYISNNSSNSLYVNEDNISKHKEIDNFAYKKEQNNSTNKKIDEYLVEQECQNIYEKLKKKELSFLKITKELESEDIYIKDCKSTNDVIRRYAIKLLYGTNYLKKNDKNKEFDIRYNEMINFFKKLSNEEKQNMLNKIINTIKKDKNDYEKASEIIEEFVNYEINNNLYSLHQFKSNNVNKNNEKALNEEYNNLYNYYTAHPDYSFEILNDFKKELSSKKISFNDCEDEKDIIKRIAESRVYNSNKENKNKSKNTKRNIIVRRYSNDDNNVHTQIIIRRNGVNSDDSSNSNDDENGYQYENLDKMDDLFPNSLFSGIFKNFFGDNRNEYNEENSDQNQNDLFSELNNFFGFGNIGDNMFKKKKKSVLGFKTKEPETKNDNKDDTDILSKAIKEEKDVDIIYLLNKVQKLNDVNLKNFILQSLKNENIRKILVNAVKNGYNNTYEECKKQNDNKSMYLLQMLKQSGIF
ncbi:conserved Plasmodium protein, unknown function [Plasmodium gallinaceum]|uniref:Aspartyl protease n=1 Tax=Plasmodium gallinaceum TaxID=5849 RepID=A0A1J1H158_PLAGA|nr:conserved Plasmodium protein, unknown function [Plasmodium gallinaceum]CRG97267.1 conserved Plasmodium protein, unknown function [Plasmodium gallinaceum]